MEYFYREQYSRMEDRGHEPIQFVDIVCQLLDMLKFPPQKSPSIRKEDLRLCNMQSVFFNFLFNLNKFFQIESRDPRLVQQGEEKVQLKKIGKLFRGKEWGASAHLEPAVHLLLSAPFILPKALISCSLFTFSLLKAQDGGSEDFFEGVPNLCTQHSVKPFQEPTC